jgi:DNA repair exonuclease SbcCD ATPase subunit
VSTEIVAWGGENFMSFREPFEVRAMRNSGPGLVLVKGQNGAGKSALLVKLPAWVLYGATPDGFKYDELACRFTKGTCRGWVRLRDEQGEWTVVRTRRPATLMVEGAGWGGEVMDDVQKRIDDRLPWGPSTFRNAIVFGQGNFDRFASASQEEQIRMLDEIQGVDFSGPLAAAKAWGAGAKQRVDSLAAKLSGDEGAMGRLTRTVSDLAQARERHEADRDARLRDLRGQRAGLVAKRDQAHKALEDLGPKARRVEELRGVLAKLADAKAVADSAARDLQIAVRASTQAMEFHSTQRARLEELLKAGACPTCRAKFTPRLAGAVRGAYEPEMAEALVALQDREGGARDAERAQQAAARHLASWAKQWPVEFKDRGAAQAYLSALETREGPLALSLAQQQYEQLGEQVDRQDADLRREEGRSWDSQAALDRARADLAGVEAAISEGRTALDRARRTVQVAEYWGAAFGDRGIRSLMVDSVADFLGEHLAEHLAVLSAGEATAEVSATSTTKGGKVREDLTITPTWQDGARGAGASGGQNRRVDLAVFAALQDLAESRSASPFPFRVYDEPLDNLDQRGKEILGQWLQHQARTRGTVFVTTHSEEMEGLLDPDEVITVAVDDAGSRVEV